MTCYTRHYCEYAGKNLPNDTRECQKPDNMLCYFEEHPWQKANAQQPKPKTALEIALEKANII